MKNNNECSECLWHIIIMRKGWQQLAYAMTKTREQAEMVLEAVKDLATDAELGLSCDQGSNREKECYVWTPDTGWTSGAWS